MLTSIRYNFFCFIVFHISNRNCGNLWWMCVHSCTTLSILFNSFPLNSIINKCIDRATLTCVVISLPMTNDPVDVSFRTQEIRRPNHHWKWAIHFYLELPRILVMSLTVMNSFCTARTQTKEKNLKKLKMNFTKRWKFDESVLKCRTNWLRTYFWFYFLFLCFVLVYFLCYLRTSFIDADIDL